MTTTIARHTALLILSLLLVLTLIALMVSAYVFYPEAVNLGVVTTALQAFGRARLLLLILLM